MMNNPKEEGPMEKILREKQTLKDLSKATGIPYRTIQSYNQRKSKPSFENVIAIAKAQNLSLVAIGEAFGFDVGGLPYA